MAITLDQYTPVALTDAVNKIVMPPTMVTDLFFGRSKTHGESTIQYEVKTASKAVAKLGKIGAKARTLAKESKVKRTFRPPQIRLDADITAADILAITGDAQVTLNNAASRNRMDGEIADQQMKLKNTIVRTKEFLACLVLQGGFSLTIDGELFTFDALMDSTHKPVLLGQAKWDGSAADIVGNITEWGELIDDDHGVGPTTGIMGTSAAAKFLADATVQKELLASKMLSGSLQRNLRTSFLGNYAGIDWYKSAKSYIDYDGNKQKYIPAGGVILGDADAIDNVMHYGAVDDVEAGRFDVEFFSKMWVNKDDNVVKLLVHSNPLPVIGDPDAVVFATVL